MMSGYTRYSEFYEAAARTIETQPALRQGNTPTTACCCWTAIDGYGKYKTRIADLIKAIRELHPDYSLAEVSSTEGSLGTHPIFIWNDEPGRTPAEVAAVLRKAGELAGDREIEQRHYVS